jgi:hypothetical protein
MHYAYFTKINLQIGEHIDLLGKYGHLAILLKSLIELQLKALKSIGCNK